MAGMFRGGHKRPTFDTPVEFLPINQIAADRSGGYGAPQTVYGEWSAPVLLPETDVNNIENMFIGADSGAIGSTGHIYVWDGHAYYRVDNDNDVFYRRAYSISNGSISYGPLQENPYPYLINNANAWTDGSSAIRFIYVETVAASTAAKHLPEIANPNIRTSAILVDRPDGQSLYWCDQVESVCKHFSRAVGDGRPAPQTHMADVKDVAGAERVIGNVAVAVRTKSLVFAHASVKPLLDAEGAIAKDWKVRIDGRDMDIVGVMDGWVPNQYTKIVVEDRS